MLGACSGRGRRGASTTPVGAASAALAWLIAALVGAALALTAAGPAAADPAGDKRKVDQELARTDAALEAATDKARRAVAEFNKANAALPAAQAALEEARGRVLGAETAARRADREAAEARAAAEAADAEYQRAADAVERGRREVSAFVAAAYRGNTVALFNAVLESESPSDLANRVGYLDHVASAQNRAMAELTAARTEAAKRADVAEVRRAAADQAAAVAAKALAEAKAAQAEAERAAAGVQAIIDQRSAASAAAEAERGAVLRQYNELKAQSDRLAAELRAAADDNKNGGGGTSTVPSGSSGGYFTMPVHGWKSSDYGNRYDPYYKVWQLHAGTDFAAAGGSPIVAAASGRVVRTGWAGGYGNYTCILHGTYQGRSLSTCYGHQSAILVHTGQTVGRGQLIGRVGSTGASTGNHLHFEVRLNGSPVNPLGWLPGCLC